jgi:hypothetical protein
MLFVIAVAFIFYNDIRKEFSDVALMHGYDPGDEVLVPMLCGKARGVAGADYTTQEGRDPGLGTPTRSPTHMIIVGM